MPPPPFPEANRTSGNGPFPSGSRKPIGAYSPSIVSTYIRCTGMCDPDTGRVMETFRGSSADGDADCMGLTVGREPSEERESADLDALARPRVERRSGIVEGGVRRPA